jgi:hypothetical protein
VLDLTTLGYALRLRWEWLARTEPQHLWTQLPSHAERIVRAMFEVSVTVQLGDGARALFWSDRWLDAWGCRGIHGASVSCGCIAKGAQAPDGCGCGAERALGTGHFGVSVHTSACAVHFPVVQSAGASAVR